MSKIRINLALDFTLPEEGLNVNSLLVTLRRTMKEVFFAMVKTFLSAIEQREIEKLKEKTPHRYVRKGYQNRLLRTSFGPLKCKLARVYDRKKRGSFAPLAKAIFLPKHKQYTKEAMEPPAGLVVHVSFRRAVSENERMTAGKVGKDALHSWLQEFSEKNCKWPDLKKIPYRYLLVDGTKVHLQRNKGEDLGKKHMRWALASQGERNPFDIVGFWIDKSWDEIGKDLKQRLNYSLLEVLFSDGEEGIEEALLEEGMMPQRCTIHGKRDFPYLLYKDGVKKDEQTFFKDKLKENPAFHFTKKKLETLSPEDAPRIEELAHKAQGEFKEMIELLDPKKYPHARTYISNLSQNITTFFALWLEKGECIPLTTNVLESRFSQVKNRIKNIGRRWSEDGLLNWLMVTLNKIFCPQMWKELWDQYLELNPDFQLIHLEARYQWI